VVRNHLASVRSRLCRMKGLPASDPARSDAPTRMSPTSDVTPDHDAPPETTRPVNVTTAASTAKGNPTLKAVFRAVDWLSRSPGPKS
jgi:hypothetical protein